MKPMRRMLNRAVFFSILLIPSFCLASAEAVKVKVIVDNASIKAGPEIGGQTLANVPLGTVLEAE